MKHLIKRLKPAASLILAICAAWLLYLTADLFLRLDLSQDYRDIQGYENIVLERNGWDQYYKRTFWGLKKTASPQGIKSDNRHDSDQSHDRLNEWIDTDNYIRQSIYSPDKRYVLYCEVIYDYKHSETTDDEYCIYKVYEIESGKSFTIYQAYREWYNLFWLP